MISVLTPSRGRPEMLNTMIASAKKCEHCVYLDEDDAENYKFPPVPERSAAIRVFVGPRQSLGKAWNKLAEKATGDYLMMGNDDLVFRDKNWKERLEETISPDQIAVACFDDGLNGPNHFAFPIVTRAWYETLGYFAPELFSFGFHDTWIFDIAQKAGCANYIGDVLVEHLHPTVGKRPVDQTFRERNWANDPQIFRDSEVIRQKHAEVIKEAIHAKESGNL